MDNNNPFPSPTDVQPTVPPVAGFPAAAAQDPTFGAVPGGFPPVVPLSNQPPKRGLPKMATFVGVLFLFLAVGAGVLLVQQQQNINEGASDAQCYSVDTNACTFSQNPTHCWRATTNNACRRLDGTVDGTLEVFSGFGAFDGQVCYTCDANSLDNGTRKCSAGTLVETNPACGGTSTTPPNETLPPTATEPPLGAVCGESCSADSDCRGSTIPGVAVSCRQGKCVNSMCADRGGNTISGTRCDCDMSTGQCGEPCGAAIGLCDASKGLSCTYLARNQCSASTQWPVCVPFANNATGRGAMPNVPLYQNAAFEQRQCGSGTSDPNNNYIYHPAFTTGVTAAQVTEFICNPETDTPSGQCLVVRIYDTNWNELTTAQKALLKPGDTIRVTVAGSGTSGTIDQARFTFNGTLRTAVTQKKPNSQEFYDEVTIPASATTVTVKGELHHTTLGWF